MITRQLNTDRMILRALSISDADEAFENWTSDDDVSKYTGWSTHKSKLETIEWLRSEEKNSLSDCHYNWGFILKSTGELIGSGGIKFVEQDNMYEIGYNIMKKYWGQGLTTEALKKILEFSREVLNIHNIIGKHAIQNISSERVLIKLGFSFIKFGNYKSSDGAKNFEVKEYSIRI